MAENQPLSFADSIREARERLGSELRAQAEHILRLNQDLAELQLLHGRTEQEASRQWDEVTRAAELAAAASEAAAAAATAEAATAAATAEAAAATAVAAAAEAQTSSDKALENVLTAVRSMMTCTIPEQLFGVFTEESAQWGVRAAIFDVRGKAAWGASAHGFGPALSEKVLRSLIIQLNQDNPFRQVCETAGPVDASAETLKKNRNLLDKLKPAPHAPVLLLPIRSAGTVTAIFYADPGEKGDPLPVNALKILAEFAGAQIDRLIALSGGFSEDEVDQGVLEAAESETPVEEAPVEFVEAEVVVEEPAPAEPSAAGPVPEETHTEESAVEAPVIEATVVEADAGVEGGEPPLPEPEPPAPPVEVAAEPPEVVVPVVESEPVPPVVEEPVEIVPPPPPVEPPPPESFVESVPPPAPAAPAGFDILQLSEAEQKVHKDAKRFAKILVSEIELYNKTKVAEGRKNRDLYKRLKSDIDRSRQTFDKRFGKVLSKQFDYFDEELIKTLAMNDPELLGPEYPGSSA